MKFFIVFLTTMTHSTQALRLTHDIKSLLHRDYVDHIRVCYVHLVEDTAV